MALTLQCLDPANDAAASCELYQLWWEGTYNYTSLLGMDTSPALTLMRGTDASVGVDWSSRGTFSESISTSEGVDFEDLFVRFSFEARSVQFAAPGKAVIVEASWWIRAVYECVPSGGGTPRYFETILYEPAGTEDHCWVVVDVTSRAFAHSSNSGAYGVQYSSAPLADCSGAVVDSGEFQPLPATSIDYSGSPEGSVCLYASGGTPPYIFGVSGILPKNMSLDIHTGCITGKLVDRGASREYTFSVSDANRDIATVTCNFMMKCGGIRGPMNRAH